MIARIGCLSSADGDFGLGFVTATFDGRGRGLLIERDAQSAVSIVSDVTSAIASMGLSLPPRRITVSLGPSMPTLSPDLALPVALAVLGCIDVIAQEDLAEHAAHGGVSASGDILPVARVLPAALASHAAGLSLVCPASQGSEAAWAGCGVVAAPDLLSLVNHFRGSQVLSPPDTKGLEPDHGEAAWVATAGLEVGRRCLEIAAAGSHSVLLVSETQGSAWAVTRALAALLPDLTSRAILALAVSRSAAGVGSGALAYRPPIVVLTDVDLEDGEPTLAGSPCLPGLVSGGILFSGDTASARLFPPGLQEVRAAEASRAICRWHFLIGTPGVLAVTSVTTSAVRANARALSDTFDLCLHLEPARWMEPSGESLDTVRARILVARRRLYLTRRNETAAAYEPEATAVLTAATNSGRVRVRQAAAIRCVALTIAAVAGSPSVRRQDMAEALALRVR